LSSSDYGEAQPRKVSSLCKDCEVREQRKAEGATLPQASGWASNSYSQTDLARSKPSRPVLLSRTWKRWRSSRHERPSQERAVATITKRLRQNASLCTAYGKTDGQRGERQARQSTIFGTCQPASARSVLTYGREHASARAKADHVESMQRRPFPPASPSTPLLSRPPHPLITLEHSCPRALSPNHPLALSISRTPLAPSHRTLASLGDRVT